MAQALQTRMNRQANPARWQRAAQRAMVEGIQVRQLNDSGAWVATSGSDPTLAYTMEVVAGVVRSCSCPAGDFGDPCCKHAGRFYVNAGLIDPADDPEPPAPCFWCGGSGRVPNDYYQRYDVCATCGGSGTRPAPQRIAA